MGQRLRVEAGCPSVLAITLVFLDEMFSLAETIFLGFEGCAGDSYMKHGLFRTLLASLMNRVNSENGGKCTPCFWLYFTACVVYLSCNPVVRLVVLSQ